MGLFAGYLCRTRKAVVEDSLIWPLSASLSRREEGLRSVTRSAQHGIVHIDQRLRPGPMHLADASGDRVTLLDGMPLFLSYPDGIGSTSSDVEILHWTASAGSLRPL